MRSTLLVFHLLSSKNYAFPMTFWSFGHEGMTERYLEAPLPAPAPSPLLTQLTVNIYYQLTDSLLPHPLFVDVICERYLKYENITRGENIMLFDLEFWSRCTQRCLTLMFQISLELLVFQNRLLNGVHSIWDITILWFYRLNLSVKPVR